MNNSIPSNRHACLPMGRKVKRLKPTGRKPKLENLYLRVKRKIAHIENPKGDDFKIFTNLGKAALDMIHPKWIKKTESYTQASFINFINHYSNYGFSADVPKSELQKDDIRRIKAVSNSKLTRLLYQLKGKDLLFPARCLVFGAAFHAMILEPDRFYLPDYNLRNSEKRNLDEMFKAVMDSELLHSLLAKSETEVSHIWIDKLTGLKCKAKFDLVVSKENLIDFKTTSARSKEEFEIQLQQYDYDRQTAFYLDGFGGISFMVFGIQKYPPYKIFHKIYHIDSDFVKQGRKKYRFLMQKLTEVNSAALPHLAKAA